METLKVIGTIFGLLTVLNVVILIILLIRFAIIEKDFEKRNKGHVQKALDKVEARIQHNQKNKRQR